MNVINFNHKACEKIRVYFDSYVDNELLVETNHEVLLHLESCEECRSILAGLIRMKKSVRSAVERRDAPAELVESVQKAIRTSGRRSFSASDFGRWPLIAAATIVLAFGGLLAGRMRNLFEPLLPGRDRDALEFISLKAQEIMRVGLIDHVHCALQAKKWQQPLTLEAMQQATGSRALGPEFIGLVSLVKEKAGADFHIVQGHRCFVNGKEYVHLILTGPNQEILSLVVTERSAEAFSNADIASTHQVSNVPLYMSSQGQLQVAGFETNHYLAYVISNMDRDANLKVASSLAPSVYNFLKHLDA
jgi:anti-sigma factor RsiW